MARISKSDKAKLTAAGIQFEVEDGEFVIAKPYEGEIRDGLTSADIDTEATEAMVKLACQILPHLGGFACGWGGWHLRPGHVNRDDDFCDVGSRHHY